ncbi:Atxe2 family lasso peptide isopeptidase [Sphingomonas koreensis]
MRRCAGAAAMLLSVSATGDALARCRSDLPEAAASTVAGTDITPEDLVRLRDIGPVAANTFGRESPLGVSPDGRRVAFQMRQADPDTNSYCLVMVVLDLRSGRQPVIVDHGGTMVRVRFTRGPLAGYFAGDAKVIAPAWSPDGNHIAFLKQMGAQVQLWIARADGGGSRRLTNSGVDVEAFRWNPDGASIVFKARTDLEAQRRAIEREGLDGYLYDDRWSPVASNRPWPRDTRSPSFEIVGLEGSLRPADAAERRRLEEPAGAGVPKNALWVATSLGSKAWSALSDSPRTYNETQLWIERDGKPPVKCEKDECRGTFDGLWWDATGRKLWFLRREGWAKSELALYVMDAPSGASRRVLVTRDLIAGCVRAEDRLLCALEQSARPRRIVSVDPETGAIGEIFDPNPGFVAHRKGKVERLEWRNDRGIEIFGDLVLPPDWRAASKPLPLIIVQYRTRGFLRGGTNDEFPIFAFAAAGFAVLSLDRPGFVSDLGLPKEGAGRRKANYEGWADRRSVMSAYASGIQLLVDRGIVDPKRVGITGMSDGTASAQFALVNSDLFAAASLSACCEEPKTLLPLMGNFGTNLLRDYLYPAYTDEGHEFWDHYSMARNAATMRTPLLMQSADDEYLVSLETYASLREKKVPVELVVFANEHHMKWQPAHRLAIYRRNLAWFDFWLRGKDEPYGRPSELRRWREMRATAESADKMGSRAE